MARRGSSHEITSFPNRAAALPRCSGGPRRAIALPESHGSDQTGIAAEAHWPGQAIAECIPFPLSIGKTFPGVEIQGVTYAGRLIFPFPLPVGETFPAIKVQGLSNSG